MNSPTHHAERAHDDMTARETMSYNAAVQFALEAIRTAALINGGAVVASLAFAGSLYQATKPELAKQLLAVPAAWFLAGVMCAGLASAAAYMAQYCFTGSQVRVQKTWEHPYRKELRGQAAWRHSGTVFQILSIALVLGSYAILAKGMLAARFIVVGEKLFGFLG